MRRAHTVIRRAAAALLLFASAACSSTGGQASEQPDDVDSDPPETTAVDGQPDDEGPEEEDDTVAQADVPTEIEASDFALTPDMTELEPALDALEAELGSGRHRTVTEMMEEANRDERALCNQRAYQPVDDQAGGDLQGFCWNDGDDGAEYWYTQGTTTTGDAAAGGTYEDQQLVATSWYHRPDDDPSTSVNKGVRISFDPFEADGSPDQYRHVLLVEPTLEDGVADYKPIPIHAGGIFWYDNLLYVADTSGGLRIFDMERLYAVDTGDNDLIGLQPDRSYHAFNYALVLPQVGWAHANTEPELHYSFVGLDRSSTPHSFIVGEYAPPEGGGTRAVRYPLDESAGLPAVAPGEEVAYATEAYDTGFLQMQGAVAQGDRWWFASSNGRVGGPEGRYGFLRVWDRGDEAVRTYDWAYGPEDLSYWADPEGVDRIWTNTEYPGWRSVSGAPADSFD